jgi:MSHA biogenesis protein MshO
MSGLTLIELVVAMVLVAIIVGATIYFVYPLRQAVDLTARAELTDIADNALQRIGREVRLALPNSVRTRISGTSVFLEFIPVRTAGRYRAETSGAACGAGTDELAFDTADACFRTIGTVTNAGTVTTGDFLVLNNYGPGFTGQNAYENPGINRRRINALVANGTNGPVIFTPSTAFTRALHESPGKRFYIVNGNGTTGLPEPVTYECTPPTITRRWGYAMVETPQPIAFGIAPSAPIADNVTDCHFDYSANVASQVGLLTLRLTLSRVLSGGETVSVSLYHAIHISNVP